MHITWFGHASFKIVTQEGFAVYIDPFAGEESEYGQIADLILVSNEGYHHLSYGLIKKISADSTLILASSQAAYEVAGTALAEGEQKSVGPVRIKAVPAYSMREGTGRKRGTALGFLITLENKVLYFAGSTDLIPEMKEIRCDIALLPVSPTRTMNPQQAVESVKIIKPKLAIPMHYGVYGGSVEDAEMFKELVEQETDVVVWILEEGRTYEI